MFVCSIKHVGHQMTKKTITRNFLQRTVQNDDIELETSVPTQLIRNHLRQAAFQIIVDFFFNLIFMDYGMRFD